jgi:class 3 adenylate cyclase
MSAANGGQILASSALGSAVADRLPTGAAMVPLGSFTLKGIVGAEFLYRIVGPGAVDLPPRGAPVEGGAA